VHDRRPRERTGGAREGEGLGVRPELGGVQGQLPADGVRARGRRRGRGAGGPNTGGQIQTCGGNSKPWAFLGKTLWASMEGFSRYNDFGVFCGAGPSLRVPVNYSLGKMSRGSSPTPAVRRQFLAGLLLKKLLHENFPTGNLQGDKHANFGRPGSWSNFPYPTPIGQHIPGVKTFPGEDELNSSVRIEELVVIVV